MAELKKSPGLHILNLLFSNENLNMFVAGFRKTTL